MKWCKGLIINKANGRGRTDDLRITNALLYQLSYVGKQGNFIITTDVYYYYYPKTGDS